MNNEGHVPAIRAPVYLGLQSVDAMIGTRVLPGDDLFPSHDAFSFAHIFWPILEGSKHVYIIYL